MIHQHINGLSLTKHSLNDLSCMRKSPFDSETLMYSSLHSDEAFSPFQVQALQITFPQTDPYQYKGIKDGDVHSLVSSLFI